MKIKYNEGGKADPIKNLYKKRINAARQLLKDAGVNNPNLSDEEVEKAAKVKNVWAQAGTQAKQAMKKTDKNYGYSTKFGYGGKMKVVKK